MIAADVWRTMVLAGALSVHLCLVWSVASQPLDGTAPPSVPRFATARLHFDAVNWPGPGADFLALYHAGIQARRGLSPYDQQEAPRVTPYFFRYIYSPLLAETLGRLVTLFPPATAYRMWLLVIEGCLFACLIVFWRHTGDALSRIAGSVLLLLSQPYVLELHMGQFTFVAASLALLAASRVERAEEHGSKALLAAPLLMMAALLKTFPFVTLPAYLRHRRGLPAASGAALAAISMGIWSLFAQGGPKYLAAFALADEFDGPHPGSFSMLQAVFVIVSATAGAWLPRVIGALPLVVMGALLTWTAWRVLRAPRRDVVLGSAVLLVAFFLGFLHVWEHHYSAVVLAGVFLLNRIAAEGTLRSLRAPLLVALVVIAAPSPYALVSQDPRTWAALTWLLMAMSKALPAVVIFAIGIRALHMKLPAREGA
jgi:hypothetical protein